MIQIFLRKINQVYLIKKKSQLPSLNFIIHPTWSWKKNKLSNFSSLNLRFKKNFHHREKKMKRRKTNPKISFYARHCGSSPHITYILTALTLHKQLSNLEGDYNVRRNIEWIFRWSLMWKTEKRDERFS